MLHLDPSMSTGDVRLDFQHQTLIDKFNELTHALELEAAGDAPGSVHDPAGRRQTVGDILDFLEFYAAWHFKQEEQRMDAVDCPVADLNRQEHGDFLARLSDFHIRWLKSNMDRGLALAVHTELARWIAQHILLVDTKLRETTAQGG